MDVNKANEKYTFGFNNTGEVTVKHHQTAYASEDTTVGGHVEQAHDGSPQEADTDRSLEVNLHPVPDQQQQDTVEKKLYRLADKLSKNRNCQASHLESLNHYKSSSLILGFYLGMKLLGKLKQQFGVLCTVPCTFRVPTRSEKFKCKTRSEKFEWTNNNTKFRITISHSFGI